VKDATGQSLAYVYAREARVDDPSYGIVMLLLWLYERFPSRGHVRFGWRRPCRGQEMEGAQILFGQAFPPLAVRVAQRLHVKQPVRNSPRLSILVNGCLH